MKQHVLGVESGFMFGSLTTLSSAEERKMQYSLHCMEESLEVKGAAMEASPSFTTCT